MIKTKWAPDVTIRDCIRANPELKRLTPDMTRFYEAIIKDMVTSAPPGLAECDIGSSLRESVIDFLYERYGRPKWFVSRDVFELLKTLKIESEDLTGIHIPNDVFTLVFEHGCEIEDLPLRSLRVCQKRSKLTESFLAELPQIIFEADPGTINLLVDAGEPYGSPECSWDTGFEVKKWNWSRPLAEVDLDVSMEAASTLSDQEKNYMRGVSKLLGAALLYRAARPELLEEFKLPRYCRFNYRGDRKTYRRLLTPKAQTRPSRDGQATGRTVKGHYRGYVLRVLRDKRFKRNEDGSYKTVLVEPVEIKGGPDGLDNG